MDADRLGKEAEKKIFCWLNHPESGSCIYRIPDQMTGMYGSKNPSDFVYYKQPDLYWIESKATFHDRFDFSALTDFQYESLTKYNKIEGVHGIVIVLFASYKRAFILNIKDIAEAIERGDKSINIKKVNKWTIPYREIQTLPSRKELLDYDPAFLI